MKSVLIVFVGLVFVFGVESLRCPKCDPSKCPDVDLTACERGTIKDACFCCTVCKRTLGEKCGGPWSVEGECEIPFYCVKPYPPKDIGMDMNDYEFIAKGICKPLT